MICDKCKKNPASIILKKQINGENIVQHLCEKCAAEENFTPISFEDLFKGLINMAYANNNTAVKREEAAASATCPNCGLTLDRFRKTGKLGCAQCYDTFQNYLETSLKSIHGSSLHTGKIPKRSGEKMIKRNQIKDLKQQLSKAVAEEEFEQAAMLRDKIRAMEKEE